MKYRSAGGNSLNVQKSELNDLTRSGTNGKCKQSMFWRCKKVAFSCGVEDVRAKKNVLMNLILKHWALMLAHFSFTNYFCVTMLCKINMLGWTLFFESSSPRFEVLFNVIHRCLFHFFIFSCNIPSYPYPFHILYLFIYLGRCRENWFTWRKMFVMPTKTTEKKGKHFFNFSIAWVKKFISPS